MPTNYDPPYKTMFLVCCITVAVNGASNAAETESKWTTYTTTYACQYVHSSGVRKEDGQYVNQRFRLEEPFFVKSRYSAEPEELEPEDEFAALLKQDSFSSVEIDTKGRYVLFGLGECKARFGPTDCASNNSGFQRQTLAFDGTQGVLTTTRLPDDGNISVSIEVFKCQIMGSDAKTHDHWGDYLD